MYGHESGFPFRGIERNGRVENGITLVVPKLEKGVEVGFSLSIADPLLAQRFYLLSFPVRGQCNGKAAAMLTWSVREPKAPFRQLFGRELTVVDRWETYYFQISTDVDLKAGAYVFSASSSTDRLQTVMIGEPIFEESAHPPKGAMVETISIKEGQ